MEGNKMDEMKLEKLYELLEQAQIDNKEEDVAALRWAIIILERNR